MALKINFSEERIYSARFTFESGSLKSMEINSNKGYESYTRTDLSNYETIHEKKKFFGTQHTESKQSLLTVISRANDIITKPIEHLTVKLGKTTYEYNPATIEIGRKSQKFTTEDASKIKETVEHFLHLASALPQILKPSATQTMLDKSQKAKSNSNEIIR